MLGLIGGWWRRRGGEEETEGQDGENADKGDAAGCCRWVGIPGPLVHGDEEDAQGEWETGLAEKERHAVVVPGEELVVQAAGKEDADKVAGHHDEGDIACASGGVENGVFGVHGVFVEPEKAISEHEFGGCLACLTPVEPSRKDK